MSSISTVKRGLNYEKQCRQFLQSHLAMRLTVSGGPNDQGVDIRGSWTLQALRSVIVQCKHYNKPVGPAVVREMEGTAAYYELNGTLPALSVICASSGFTQASWKRALASRFPLLLLHLQTANGQPGSQNFASSIQDLTCAGVWMNAPFAAATGDYIEVVQYYDMLTKTRKSIIRMRAT